MKTRRILFVIAWLRRIKLKTSLKAFLSGMEFSVYIWLIHCAHGAVYKISIQPFNGCLVYENCLLYTFTLFQQKGSALKTLRLIPLFIFEQNMAFVLSIITKNEGINVYSNLLLSMTWSKILLFVSLEMSIQKVIRLKYILTFPRCSWYVYRNWSSQPIAFAETRRFISPDYLK